MSYALIADIGGTNARFALAPLLAKHDIHELNEESLREIRKYSGTDFATIGEAIEQYIADIADNYARPSVGLIAIAAAVNQDEIAMINHYWRFSQQQLKADLGFEALFFINDFNAQANALPFFDQSNLLHLGGPTQAVGPKVVTGPGTGLGFAVLTEFKGFPVVLETEAGHSHFAPCTPDEHQVSQIVAAQFGRCSNERLICGTGLPNLYNALAQITGLNNQEFTAPDITHHAINKSDELAELTLAHFCRMFGSFVGDHAIATGASGGVYISGGIIPRFIDYFLASDFYAAFVNKGRMQGWMEQLPCYLITAKEPGLLGAAAAINYKLY